jgi:AraC-like DNA-binding protein
MAGVLSAAQPTGSPMPISASEYFHYLPVSDLDRQWGVFVTGVGRTRVPPFSKSYPVSVHPDYYQFRWQRGRVLQEYQALYIVRGDGEFEAKAIGNQEVRPGTVMLLFPGHWHRYRPHRAIGWDEYWISFGGEYVDQLTRHGFISPQQPLLHTGVDDAILHPYLAVLDRVQTDPIGCQQLVSVNVLEILAAALAALRRQRSSSRYEGIVREAKALIEQHAAKLMSIEQLSSRFRLSEKHFRRLFKAHTGLSPYQYYSQTRIHRAKEMLLGTTLSIKQIAAALHFENAFHFSKAFKDKAGMPPSQWRNGASKSE